MASQQSNVLGQVSFLLRSDYFQGFLSGAYSISFMTVAIIPDELIGLVLGTHRYQQHIKPPISMFEVFIAYGLLNDLGEFESIHPEWMPYLGAQ